MFRTTKSSSSGRRSKHPFGVLSCVHISSLVTDRICLYQTKFYWFFLHKNEECSTHGTDEKHINYFGSKIETDHLKYSRCTTQLKRDNIWRFRVELSDSVRGLAQRSCKQDIQRSGTIKRRKFLNNWENFSFSGEASLCVVTSILHTKIWIFMKIDINNMKLFAVPSSYNTTLSYQYF